MTKRARNKLGVYKSYSNWNKHGLDAFNIYIGLDMELLVLPKQKEALLLI